MDGMVLKDHKKDSVEDTFNKVMDKADTAIDMLKQIKEKIGQE